jgi:hypothetical protein
MWVDSKLCIWNRRGNKYPRLSVTSYCIGDQTVDRDLPVDRGKLVGRSWPLFGLYQNLSASSLGSVCLLLTAFFVSTYFCEGLLIDGYNYQYNETNVMQFLFSLLRINASTCGTPILVQPTDITRTQYTKCRLCITSWGWASNARNM